MSNFAALIATIQANIKTNGNEEITGAVLQDVLEAMVQALGTEAINNLETALGNEETARQNADGALQNNIDAEALRAGTAEAGLDGRIDTIDGKIPSAASSSNKLADKAYVDAADTALSNAIGAIEDAIENGYVYAGIATPSGTPVSGKVFYLAVTAGTYTNFGGLVVTQGINILKYNGTAWSQEQLIGIDDEPTANSNNLVKSGGVYNFGLKLGCFFNGYIDLNTSSHLATIKKNNPNDQYALIVTTSTGTAISTSFAHGDTFQIPSANNFYIAYKISTGTMIALSTLPDRNDYIIFGYYLVDNVTLNIGVIKINGIEKTITTEYIDRKIALFADKWPFVKELYINSDGKTADVGMLHSVTSGGAVMFAKSDGSAFTAIARGGQFGKINFLKVTGYPTETIDYGYIVIDLTGFSGELLGTVYSSPIKDAAYDISYSPYIYSHVYKPSYVLGQFFGGYLDLNTTTHVGTIKTLTNYGASTFVIVTPKSVFNTSIQENDTFAIPDANNFIIFYDMSAGEIVATTNHALIDYDEDVIFGLYRAGGGLHTITSNLGVIKVNGNERYESTAYLNDVIDKNVANACFVEGCKYVKELYINEAGVTADVGLVNNVTSGGAVLFALTDGSAYCAIARGGVFGKINYLTIVNYPGETTVLGHIVIDLTDFAGEFNIIKPITHIAKDIAYSPYINSKQANTLPVGSIVGDTINIYDHIVTLAADGSGDYTTFDAAHNACAALSGKVLMLIKTGTYDIDAATKGGLGYSVKYSILGVGDVTIKCIYEGDDTSIRQDFSPITCTNTPGQHQTVRIENIKIVVSRVRYCVHDEMGHLTTPSYTHIYKNCKFIHLSEPDSVHSAPRCIGGGLGNKGLVIIENCEFKSVIEDSVDYHTGHSGGAESSKVIIKNCVLANNTVSCMSTTYASDKSVMIVQDCILHSLPFYTDSNNHKDMELIEKNNIIV